MMNLLKIIFAAILLSVILPPVQAGWFDNEETKKKLEKKDEPDYLTLAALMIRDGHYDRAETILKGIDTTEEGFNFVKYHTLKGLVSLNQGEMKMAQDRFLEAIKAAGSEVDPILYVYIAQAYYGEQNFERTIWALDSAGSYIYNLPDLLGVKATCHWSIGQKPEALAVLDNAEHWYPERSAFKIQKIFYLIELELFQQAVEESDDFLQRFGDNSKSYMIVGEALRRAKSYDQAVVVLEKGRLLFPNEIKLILSLGHTYMQSGKNIAAAKLFEQAAAFDPKYLEQSIGLYRMVNNNWKAKFLNAQVGDAKKKLKNWLEILLAEEKYEEILAIEERLKRYGTLKDDKMRYAMAYVHFISEQYDQSETYLKGISDPKIFKNAVKLLKAIEVYRAEEKKTSI